MSQFRFVMQGCNHAQAVLSMAACVQSLRPAGESPPLQRSNRRSLRCKWLSNRVNHSASIRIMLSMEAHAGGGWQEEFWVLSSGLHASMRMAHHITRLPQADWSLERNLGQ